MSDADVRFAREGAWGVITLSRPKALNSLTLEMCAMMDRQLRAWQDDDAVRAVLIEGEGDKAFCAGGDIRWLATTAKEESAEAAAMFFRQEYKLNTLIAEYKKPYVALIDGICMGGGVGVSAMADRRVATERTLWAMPECGIGLIPDVGASYILQQLPGGLPLYLALTGARLRGYDCVAAEIATDYLPSARVPVLREALLGLDLLADPLAAIDAVLRDRREEANSELPSERGEIDRHFGAVESLDALFANLENAGGFGAKCLEAIRPASPTSLALTLKLLNEAPDRFADCIAREFYVTAHLMEGPDFLEGVRAQIIDKDRTPKWQPASLNDVRAETIARYFETPPGGPLEV